MNINHYQKPVIFILSHYDDEFGIFNQIKYHKICNDDVIVIYLTSSSLDGEDNILRRNKTIKILNFLGITDIKDIFLIGGDNKIPDLKLHLNLEIALKEVTNIIDNFKEIKAIYTLSYEGGHPDHDSTFLISSIIYKKFLKIKKLYQFPLYSGRGLSHSFFRLFSPIRENGEVIKIKITFKNRLLFLMLFYSYIKVQPKAIIGLSFFYSLHIIFLRTQILQKTISFNLVYRKPHHGDLLYERRGMATYQEYRKNVDLLLKSTII